MTNDDAQMTKDPRSYRFGIHHWDFGFDSSLLVETTAYGRATLAGSAVPAGPFGI
jgi:hypothetical protein